MIRVKSCMPMFETKNLQETIDFYTQNLGFTCRSVYQPDGAPCWANLLNGEVEIGFGLPNAHTNFVKPNLTGSLYLRVENIDDAWDQLKNKVEIVYPIENFPYQMREFGIRDCNGYILNLGWETEN